MYPICITTIHDRTRRCSNQNKHANQKQKGKMPPFLLDQNSKHLFLAPQRPSEEVKELAKPDGLFGMLVCVLSRLVIEAE